MPDIFHQKRTSDGNDSFEDYDDSYFAALKRKENNFMNQSKISEKYLGKSDFTLFNQNQNQKNEHENQTNHNENENINNDHELPKNVQPETTLYPNVSSSDSSITSSANPEQLNEKLSNFQQKMNDPYNGTVRGGKVPEFNNVLAFPNELLKNVLRSSQITKNMQRQLYNINVQDFQQTLPPTPTDNYSIPREYLTPTKQGINDSYLMTYMNNIINDNNKHNRNLTSPQNEYLQSPANKDIINGHLKDIWDKDHNKHISHFNNTTNGFINPHYTKTKDDKIPKIGEIRVNIDDIKKGLMSYYSNIYSLQEYDISERLDILKYGDKVIPSTLNANYLYKKKEEPNYVPFNYYNDELLKPYAEAYYTMPPSYYYNSLDGRSRSKSANIFDNKRTNNIYEHVDPYNKAYNEAKQIMMKQHYNRNQSTGTGIGTGTDTGIGIGTGTGINENQYFNSNFNSNIHSNLNQKMGKKKIKENDEQQNQGEEEVEEEDEEEGGREKYDIFGNTFDYHGQFSELLNSIKRKCEDANFRINNVTNNFNYEYENPDNRFWIHNMFPPHLRKPGLDDDDNIRKHIINVYAQLYNQAYFNKKKIDMLEKKMQILKIKSKDFKNRRRSESRNGL